MPCHPFLIAAIYQPIASFSFFFFFFASRTTLSISGISRFRGSFRHLTIFDAFIGTSAPGNNHFNQLYPALAHLDDIPRPYRGDFDGSRHFPHRRSGRSTEILASGISPPYRYHCPIVELVVGIMGSFITSPGLYRKGLLSLGCRGSQTRDGRSQTREQCF